MAITAIASNEDKDSFAGETTAPSGKIAPRPTRTLKAHNLSISGNSAIAGNNAVTGNSTVGGTSSVTGAATQTGAFAVTGAFTPTGGEGPAGGFVNPTVFHSGAVGANSATMGTDTTPSVTETYIVEVFVPENATLTGVSILNGSAVAGNMRISLANSSGVPIAAALTASTAASGTAAFQKVPFATPYAAVGPAKYFILLQNNNTGNRFRTHAVGNFGASKKTGETYGTFTTVTAPTTFTADLGPVADLY